MSASQDDQQVAPDAEDIHVRPSKRADSCSLKLRVESKRQEHTARNELLPLNAALYETEMLMPCSRAFQNTVADKAKAVEVEAGEVLNLEEFGGPLAIVEFGALDVQHELGDWVRMGKGSVVNIGMFCLSVVGVDALRPRSSGNKPPISYEVHHSPHESLPKTLYADIGANVDSCMAFYLTCPSALDHNHVHRSGRYFMTLKGAEPNPEGDEDEVMGGAIVALVKDVPQEGQRLDAQRFEQGCSEVAGQWEKLTTTVGRITFPGAPLEAVWALAELSKKASYKQGHVIVAEGDAVKADSALLVISEGSAVVQRAGKELGRIMAGAIIGDVLTCGLNTEWAATIKAKTDVEVVRVPKSALQKVLARFPCLTEGCIDRLNLAVDYIKKSFASPIDVLSSLDFFARSDREFLNAIAGVGSRELFYGGKIILQEGAKFDSFLVLEHGQCTATSSAWEDFKCIEVHIGSCLGEQVLANPSGNATSSVTVCAGTPAVVCLSFKAIDLQPIFSAHSAERDQLNRIIEISEVLESELCPWKVQVCKALSGINVFKKCSLNFLEFIESLVKTSAYMPGQIIVHEGDITPEEDPRLFVLTGGGAVVERAGTQYAQIQVGTTFDELFLLGLQKTRQTTVRASSFCYVATLARSDLELAIEEFPEEKEKFNVEDPYYKRAWPALQDAPNEVLYLLESRSLVRTCAAGEIISYDNAAIFIVAGEAVVTDARPPSEGENAVDLSETFPAGSCYNERVLLGKKKGEIHSDRSY
jgi:CRP-like cAMP-binding protein